MADPISAIGAAMDPDLISKVLTQYRKQYRDSIVMLSFRALQRSRLEEIQKKLVMHSIEKHHGKSNGASTEVLLSNIDQCLHSYAQALRDYETFTEGAIPDNHYSWLSTLLPLHRDRKEQEAQRVFDFFQSLGDDKNEKYTYRELDKDGREARARRKAFVDRLWLGIFGGVALTGPMILMVLHRSRNTSLITASVSTILFALILAVAGKNLKGMDVLAATAAYSAVLVVFVGTSLAPIS